VQFRAYKFRNSIDIGNDHRSKFGGSRNGSGGWGSSSTPPNGAMRFLIASARIGLVWFFDRDRAAKDLAQLGLHRMAVLGGSQPKLLFQSHVDIADGETCQVPLCGARHAGIVITAVV
jgi:hypothetical protein